MTRSTKAAAVGMITLATVLVSARNTASAKPTSAPEYARTANSYVEIDGTRYAYRTLGAARGKPPLVLFQHFTGTMDDWDSRLIDGLARSRRLYVFDSAGVGASGGTTPDSIVAMARIGAAFIDALHLGKVDMLGFSMGGCIGQQLLVDRPELVRKAILAGTTPSGGEGVIDLPKVLDDAFKRAAAAKVHPKVYLFFTETEAGHAAAHEFLEHIGNHTVDAEKPVSEETTAAQVKAIIAWGAMDTNAARLATIEQPVLVVNGSKDVMAPTPNSFVLYQHIPKAHLSLYPDSGHGALFQYHRLFVSQVDTFLDGAN